ncbi:MAG TPA: NAD(P)/FAD-dependent oxidoreductase [Candidatus Acidoferrales bacterium]|jgi:glycerol-3-phosphate dehydrogenase|nr:NAD(P)/FAD-dependent oxidoreductase [Candidatus Acidoferrales bacterium]
MERANIVIIGGGVIGCAIAYELAARWQDVFLLERAPKPGMGASTRNSGVIHSGIYYANGSFKARFCVEGNRLLHEFCAAHSVPHKRTGKLVVAPHANETAKLEALAENGRRNGVEGLEIIGGAAIRAREPHVEGAAALWVPSTGIVSAEDLVKTLARLAIDRGAHILTHARVTSLTPRAGGIEAGVEIEAAEEGHGSTHESVEARCVINCAGLYADEVAAMLGLTGYRIYPVRGEYAEIVRGRADLVRGLVYPLPHPEGMSLGVHLTRTVWDTVLVGPTARYVSRKDDYESDRLPIEEFVRRASPLLPELKVEDLRLAYSGLRAKLVPPRDASGNEPAGPSPDFVITRDPAVPSAIHLIGFESPGLTSCLAIAQHVAQLATETLI